MKTQSRSPINLISKRILISSSIWTYAVLFNILVFTVGIHTNLSHHQMIGTYVNGGILAMFSLTWITSNAHYIITKIKPFNRLNLFLVMMYIPLVGLIVNFILIRQQRAIYQQEQLVKNPHAKHKKEPMAVQLILMIVTVIMVFVIWIFYIVHGNSADQTNVIPGFFDIFLSPIKGFIDAAEIIVYLLIMGAFLQVINNSKALEAGIGRLVKKLEGKELVIIPVMMFLFSIGGATFGFCEETIPFYAIVMPVVLAAGFDAITGVTIILFGAGLGVCASVINPFMIMTSVDAVNKTLPDALLSTGDGIAFRAIIYVVFTLIGIIFTTMYASKVRKNPRKSYVYDLHAIHKSTFKFDATVVPEFTGKRKITLVIFTACFVLLIMGAIPWTDLTGWNGFDRLNQWLIVNFPFIATGVGAVGSWYLASFALLFLTATIIIGALNWQGGNNFYQNVVAGAQSFLSIAFVIAIARGLSLILTSSGFADVLAHGVAHVLRFNNIAGVIILFFAFLLISIFIPSTSGFAYTIYGPLIAPAMSVATTTYHVSYSLAGGIASASMANGLINLASPTAGVFVIGCEMAKVPLKHFYKSAWKLLTVLLIAASVLLILSTFLPKSIVGK